MLTFKGYELAQLHSNAVDFPKSGVEVKIPRYLRPRKWPHFMEKKNKPAEAVYVSKKVLGQLYDMVELVDFSPEYETPFDSRILEAYCLNESILSEAAEMKAQYDDAIKRIMAQHAIGTEFEVWSAFVLSHNFEKKDFTFAEELGRVTSALKENFRRMFIQKAGGAEKIGPLVAATYTITAKQVRAAVEKYRKKSTNLDDADLPIDFNLKAMPLMSFPWIFDRELAKIAAGSGKASEATTSRLPAGTDSSSWMQMTAETSIGKIPKANVSSELNGGVLTYGKDKHRIETHQHLLVDRSHERMIESGIKGSMRVTQETSQLVEDSHIKQATSSLSTLNNDNRRTNLDRCTIEDDDLEGSLPKVEFDTGSSAFDRLARLVAHD
jgi:RNA-dependent RNA polymerase